MDGCGEDMIPLSFTVKPDEQAHIVPNQSVKASYATAHKQFSLATAILPNQLINYVVVQYSICVFYKIHCDICCNIWHCIGTDHIVDMVISMHTPTVTYDSVVCSYVQHSFIKEYQTTICVSFLW